MKLAIIVPIKQLEAAKTRLGEALDPEERAELAAQMLRRTLRVIAEAAIADCVAVITPDEAVFAIACEMHVTAIRQRSGGLNEALEQGRRWAISQDAATLLVLPADLPLLTADDLVNLRDMSTRYSIVIAPDHNGSGTNALLLHPPTAIPFRFGVDSYRLHLEAAAAAGVVAYIYTGVGTGLDLDMPDDIAAMALVSRLRQTERIINCQT